MKRNLLQINAGDIGGGAYEISEYLHYRLRPLWNTSMLVGEKKSNDLTIQEIRSPMILTYANLFFGLEYMFYLNTFFLTRTTAFQQADIVHYHNLHGSYFNLWALPMLTHRKPSVWTFHDMWPILGHAAHSLDCQRCERGQICHQHKSVHPKLYTWDSSAFLYHVKRFLLRRSNFHIVVPSLWLQQKVKTSFLKSKTIHLIYNGIDTDLFVPMDKSKVRKDLNLPMRKKIIIFSASGGLSNPWKGGCFIRDMIKQFATRRDLFFVSIGGKHSTFQGIPNLLQLDYITDKKQLAKYYSAGDILFSPSIAENLSLTLLEAMACGLPSLTFNVGGTSEIVDHLVNGYLAQSNDLNDLLYGMNLLLKTQHPYKMSTSARAKIVNHFTLKKMMAQYMKLYQNLIHQQLVKPQPRRNL